MVSSILSFIWKYLVGPIVADSMNAGTAVWSGVVAETGYNPVNTFFWAITALMVLYGFYRFFKSRDISFDLETVLYSLPFVILGGLIRFLEDTGVIPYPLSVVAVTPLIYILISVVYLAVLSIARRIDKRNMDRYIGFLGSAILLPVLMLSVVLLPWRGADLLFIAYSIGLSALLTSVFYLYIRGKELETKVYSLAGFSQFFGGTVSMLGVVGGGEQKQLLAQMSTEVLGPAGIIVVKAALLVAAVHILKDVDDFRTEALVLFALIVVGLGTGLRVMLRAALGV